ncbi:unnamed protein product [Blepharisma stoltei]|uniref:Uncharacterized protein n=1 Tax=Blepharisma stoltei TaxID=1481888 RepID=A0AAU9JRW2_9CILI|nr:unnamed protein product [Blepharisma stoltei]
MGANNSSEYQEISISRCGVSEIDDNLQKVLSILNRLLRNLRDLEDYARLFKNSVGLPAKPESNLLDAIKLMVICYSASCGGDFSRINLIHIDSKPYINISKASLRREYWDIYDNWNNFCRLLEDTESLAKEQENMGGFDANFDFEKLSGWHKTKLISWGLFNLNKIKKLESTIGNIDRFNANMKIDEIPSFISRIFESDYAEICEAGREAAREYMFNPKRICDKFLPRLKSIS